MFINDPAKLAPQDIHPLTLLELDKMELETLIDQAADLKEIITDLTWRLRRMKVVLASKSGLTGETRCGSLCGRAYRARIRLRENIAWDQTRLSQARAQMGEERFFQIFKPTYEPRSSKALSESLESSPHAELLRAARIVQEGLPQVNFEKISSGTEFRADQESDPASSSTYKPNRRPDGAEPSV